jgi:hypothetical protein
MLAHRRPRHRPVQIRVGGVDREDPGLGGVVAGGVVAQPGDRRLEGVGLGRLRVDRQHLGDRLARGVPLVLIDLDAGADQEGRDVARVDRQRRRQVVARGRQVVAILEDHGRHPGVGVGGGWG